MNLFGSGDVVFDDLETLYQPPTFPVKKGTIVQITVETEGSVEEFDNFRYSTGYILEIWIYLANDKRIKPFKLIRYECLGNGFQAELQFVRKSREVDELKLLCKDLLDVYNLSGIQVLSWVNKLL